MLTDEEYMKEALALAKCAFSEGEVPVGAVVVDENGIIIGKGYNKCQMECSPLFHAEIIALQNASRSKGNWQLLDCNIYVTLEPCLMCAGAIMNAHMKRIVYGTFNENGGVCSSAFNIFEEIGNYHPLIRSGILEKQCSAILTSFFEGLRH